MIFDRRATNSLTLLELDVISSIGDYHSLLVFSEDKKYIFPRECELLIEADWKGWKTMERPEFGKYGPQVVI